MRSGWSTTVALLPLLLLAGSSAAGHAARAPGRRAATFGAETTRPRAAGGRAALRAAAVEPERLFHPAPQTVSVGGEIDTGARFSAGDAASDSEPVIVELQIGRIGSRTVQAYRVGTEALVPMSVFLQMVEVRFRLSLEGQLEATIDPGGKRLLMDAHNDTISYGDRRIHIEPAFRLFANNELYIGAERLADLFQTSVLVSWEDLTVTFTDPSVFPIGRRLRRESARDAFLRRGRGFPAERMLGLERRSWDGLVLDYSFLAPSDAPFSGGSYSAAVGADAFGGSLELGVQSIGPAGNGAARIDGSWTGVWEDNRWLKQIRVGDGFTTGPRVRGERGVLLTNSPFVRPSLLGAAHYVGRLEPGWTLEAYRGGDLVAYDSADDQGRFAVELPIRYGENPVDFVAYGPFGEVREFNRTYRVLSELLPDKRFEYGLSAGQCRSALCRGTGNIDLRYGVTRRLTVQGGVDQFWRDSLPNRTHPYAAVVLNPTNALAFTAQGVGGASASAGARFEPSLNLRLDGDYTTYAHDTAPAIAPAGRRSEWGLGAQVRPIPRAGLFVLDAAVAQIRTTGGDVTTGRLAASVQTVEARLAPYVRFERNAAAGAPATARSFAGFDAFVLPRPQLGRVLGPVWMRAHIEAQSGTGFTSGQIFGPAAVVGRAHGSGCLGHARRTGRDVHTGAVELPARRPHADHGDRAARRAGDGVAVRAGLAPVEPGHRPSVVLARPVARARGDRGSRVPGREQQRPLGCGRAAGARRARVGGQRQRCVGLGRPVPRLGSSAVRAAARHRGLAQHRLAATGARVLVGERGAGAQPVP